MVEFANVKWKREAMRAANMLGVDDQFELAKALAANCGYDLVEQSYDPKKDNAKRLINEFKRPDGIIVMSDYNKALIVEGLEGLLK